MSRELTYVKVGFVGKQLAVIDGKTGEPLQFLTKQIGDPEAFQRYALKIAAYWDELLESNFARAAGSR